MASKRRIRKKFESRHCGNKQKHQNQAQAVSHLISLKNKGKADEYTTSYKCRICGKWHVGRLKEKTIAILQQKKYLKNKGLL